MDRGAELASSLFLTWSMDCTILFLQLLREFTAKQKWVKTHTPRAVIYS